MHYSRTALPCIVLYTLYILPLQWISGVDVVKKNSMRLAAVWMDEYSKYYFDRNGDTQIDFGDVSARKKLR